MTVMMPVKDAESNIREASSDADLESVRVLLREYAEYLNASLGEEHICLESYEKELNELPGAYAPPGGVLLIAFENGRPAGCGAFKPLSPKRAFDQEEVACEMKRLWVRPEFRGRGIGEKLALALMRCARERGYTAMYLDTVPTAMQAANRIYRDLGFEEVARYGTNPVLATDSPLDVKFYRCSLKT